MPKNVKKEPNESALKHLFNQPLLNRISSAIHEADSSFDRKYFSSLMPQMKDLEMKPRVLFLRDQLKKLLPEDYKKALKILLKSTKSGTLSGFDLWPYTEFIQTFGLNDLSISLEGLKQITPLFTSEWGIRPFIKRHPEKTMSFLLKCTSNADEHVRRWASEGSRPRLPWGERLQKFIVDPTPTLPILEKLKFDDSLYVRKSVSNHLNDIAKDHPDFVIKILARWKKEAGSKNLDKVDWIIRRSLRNLIKEGYVGALNLIGVSKETKIKIIQLELKESKLKLGQRLDFEFQLHSTSTKSQKLVVDYIVHFVKSNRSTAPKVFKLKTFDLRPLEKILISKSHPLKKITTRDYYSGLHWVEIQINGKIYAKTSWHLKV